MGFLPTAHVDIQLAIYDGVSDMQAVDVMVNQYGVLSAV